MKRLTLSFLAIFLFSSVGSADEITGNWKTGYREGGGGFFLKSPDENFQLTLMGYVQANQKLYLTQTYSAVTDYPLPFSVRRARFDFGSVIYKDYDVFIEVDGAPTTSVVAASPSGIGIAEARVTAKLIDNQLMLRLGKFISPFSAENFRSSRGYDVIERFMVLNSMFGLPALDAQYGAMIFGKVLDNKLTYYLMVDNGNGKVSANTPETNIHKEYQARISYAFLPELTVGAAYDRSKEGQQVVQLTDLAGASFAQLPVSGMRNGFDVDATLIWGRYSLKFEALDFEWGDAALSPSLRGGFLQAAYFLTGDELHGGFQPLLRADIAKVSGAVPTLGSKLTAITAGYQWFINANLRHQLNLIGSIPDAPGAGAYADGATKFAVLSELQLKF